MIFCRMDEAAGIVDAKGAGLYVAQVRLNPDDAAALRAGVPDAVGFLGCVLAGAVHVIPDVVVPAGAVCIVEREDVEAMRPGFPEPFYALEEFR